ncbi:MAG: hypothetical protein AB4041_12580 [Microcystaceae cyanobacterium]
MSNHQFRPINRAVGLAPRVGTFAFYQIVPALGITIGMYYLKTLVGWSWLLTAIIWGILTGSLLAVLGDKPWLFLGRVTKVPSVVRAGANYQPLLKITRQ